MFLFFQFCTFLNVNYEIELVFLFVKLSVSQPGYDWFLFKCMSSPPPPSSSCDLHDPRDRRSKRQQYKQQYVVCSLVETLSAVECGAEGGGGGLLGAGGEVRFVLYIVLYMWWAYVKLMHIPMCCSVMSWRALIQMFCVQRCAGSERWAGCWGGSLVFQQTHPDSLVEIIKENSSCDSIQLLLLLPWN